MLVIKSDCSEWIPNFSYFEELYAPMQCYQGVCGRLELFLQSSACNPKGSDNKTIHHYIRSRNWCIQSPGIA